jgi:transmembrane sensor
VIAPGETSTELSPLLKEALAWVIRLYSGEATTEDADAIQQWRQKSPEHEQAFREAVKLWRTLGDATRALVGKEKEEETRQPLLARSARLLVSRRGMLGTAIAASVVGFVVVRPPLGLWPSLEEFSADYRTGKGEQRDILLSDSVSLKLNTQTSIAVRKTSNDSQIELISGEASINAKRNSIAPLVVKAANGFVTASRAEFNARCLEGIVSVSCLDGAVVVETAARSVRLPKGEQISYNADGLGLAGPLDKEQTTAWQSGLLIVRERTLADVVDEVNRYRPGKIIVMNSKLGRRMITGTFHLDQLEDFIGQVRGLFGASVQSLPGGVVLLS